MASMTGRYKPTNPQKYLGNVGSIIFRSAWELSVMKYFDTSASVIKWGSEVVKIPYVKPTDGRVHHYFPDFIVVYTDRAGNQKTELIEVKPLKESLAEKAKTDNDKLALIINTAKWNAADDFCKRNGMTFRVITEKNIFRQAPRKPRKKK